MKVQKLLAMNYVNANEHMLKKVALRNHLIDIKSEVKTEAEVPIKADDYFTRFETEAAGFIVDELP